MRFIEKKIYLCSSKFFNLKFEPYEKEHGNHRHCDQVTDRGFGNRTVFYTGNFRNTRDNTIDLCWDLHPYKLIKFLPGISSIWH